MVELSKVQTEQIQILEDLKACGYSLTELGLPEPKTLQAEWQAEHKAVVARGRLLEAVAAPADGRDAAEPPDEQRDRCLRRDALWVYDNLHNRKAKRSDAPSAGAWGMREAYRDDPAAFFKTILPKVMNSVAMTAGRDQVEAEIQRSERKSIGQLQELLREAVEASQ